MPVSVCAYVWVYTSPKKTPKQEKRKNMQQKYLRLEACSLKIHRVFLWADLGLRKKGGKKRKEKIQKRLLAKTEKKNIKKRKEERAKRTNQFEFMVSYFVFFFSFSFKKRVQKQKQKASQTQIYHKKRHKIKENFFFRCDILLSPCRRKWLPVLLVPSFSLFLKTPVCSLSLY